MIIHNATIIQAEFCLIDEAGNVAERKPMQVVVDRFTPEAFAEAYEALKKAREEWEIQCTQLTNSM